MRQFHSIVQNLILPGAVPQNPFPEHWDGSRNRMKDYETGLTQEILKEYLDYSPDTGIFIWKKKMPKAHYIKIGDQAGFLCFGYITIRLLRSNFKAHRLAWFYTFGKWPRALIDHINMNSLDNRICNLREATYSENSQNARAKSTNTSGFKGVYYSKEWRRWFASICINGKIKFLGYHPTPEEASVAYNKAAKEMFGKFYNPSTAVAV